MNFIHSFNSKPVFIPQMYGVPIFYRMIGTIICSAMSVAFVRARGHTISLHTDDIGVDLLAFIPYDKVYRTINDIPDDFHPRFWASCKMLALEKEPLDTCHIDNDVFLKRTKVFDLIEKSDYDLLVQCKEDGLRYKKWTSMFQDLPNPMRELGLKPEEPGAFNTGIMNFRNQELKDKFIENYKKLVKNYSKIGTKYLEGDDNLIPDLIVEQTHLYQISHDYNTMRLLQPMEHNINYGHDIGYQHLLTKYKYTKLDKILGMLEQVDPILHEMVMKKCTELFEMRTYNGIDLEIPQELLENNEANEAKGKLS